MRAAEAGRRANPIRTRPSARPVPADGVGGVDVSCRAAGVTKPVSESSASRAIPRSRADWKRSAAFFSRQ